LLMEGVGGGWLRGVGDRTARGRPVQHRFCPTIHLNPSSHGPHCHTLLHVSTSIHPSPHPSQRINRPVTHCLTVHSPQYTIHTPRTDLSEHVAGAAREAAPVGKDDQGQVLAVAVVGVGGVVAYRVCVSNLVLYIYIYMCVCVSVWMERMDEMRCVAVPTHMD
jgi:hypothetical protein